jgi:hypothetical protein
LLKSLQVLQLILFTVPIGTLVVLGVIILSKSVIVLQRRLYLLVVFPLILANLLAILENNLTNQSPPFSDWRFWLVMLADLAFFVLAMWLFRGFQVIGLDASETMGVLKDSFEESDNIVHLSVDEKRTLWTNYPNAIILVAEQPDGVMEFWAVERQYEVLLKSDSPQGNAQLRKLLSRLRSIKKPYDFQVHAVGVLYIVLALVIAVLGWIFFFEPRLIIVE